jgi:2-(1,2-epoxy-1,2-dihydrophenyl)acetyl-CoA isomerase
MPDEIDVKADGGLRIITLNRPDELNAVNDALHVGLAKIWEELNEDAGARAAVITGAGRAFSAGGDVAAMDEMMEREDADEFARMLGAGRRVVTAIREMVKPVVASINGVASGAGFNLALACDLRIAAESARFSQSFVKVGLHPDWGGTYFLPRIVPPNIACEMFFLGDAIDSTRALALGLVHRVVPDDPLAAETARLAARLRDAPPESVAAAKHAVYLSQHAELDEMLQYETEAQLRCFQTTDAREGVRAFLEKRAPRFRR